MSTMHADAARWAIQVVSGLRLSSRYQVDGHYVQVKAYKGPGSEP